MSRFACVAGAGLSITSVGRRLRGPTTLKHRVKRADRLIGNPHLYRERTAVYGVARSRKSLEAARNQREPWLLLAALQFGHFAVEAIVRIDRQLMQIEAGSRDMNRLYYDPGYEVKRSRNPKRLAILVLIAALAAFLLFMIGTAAERMHLQRGMSTSDALHAGRRQRFRGMCPFDRWFGYLLLRLVGAAYR